MSSALATLRQMKTNNGSIASQTCGLFNEAASQPASRVEPSLVVIDKFWLPIIKSLSLWPQQNRSNPQRVSERRTIFLIKRSSDNDSS